MEGLPIELQALILREVDKVFDLLAIRLVCREWCHLITQDTHQISEVDRISPRVLAVFPNVHSAHIFWNYNQVEPPLRSYRRLAISLREKWDGSMTGNIVQISESEKERWGVPPQVGAIGPTGYQGMTGPVGPTGSICYSGRSWVLPDRVPKHLRILCTRLTPDGVLILRNITRRGSSELHLTRDSFRSGGPPELRF